MGKFINMGLSTYACCYGVFCSNINKSKSYEGDWQVLLKYKHARYGIFNCFIKNIYSEKFRKVIFEPFEIPYDSVPMNPVCKLRLKTDAVLHLNTKLHKKLTFLSKVIMTTDTQGISAK